MCKYCQDNSVLNEIKFDLGQLGNLYASLVLIQKDGCPVIGIETSHDLDDMCCEAYTKIKFCPMCGCELK